MLILERLRAPQAGRPESGWNRNISEALDADAGRGAGSDRDSYIMPSVFGSQIDSAGQ